MVENMPKVPTQRKYLIERVLSSSYIGHCPSFAWQFDNSCTVNSNNLLLWLCQDAYNCISASRRSFLAFKQIVQQSVQIRSPCLSALQIIRQFSMQQCWHFAWDSILVLHLYNVLHVTSFRSLPFISIKEKKNISLVLYKIRTFRQNSNYTSLDKLTTH